jgi:ribosome-associated protein
MGTMADLHGQDLACAIGRLADAKQAEDIVVLDLRGISTITDYFVICTGTSIPHLRAIHREIAERLQETEGVRPHSADGQAESQWLVLDYGDVIAHVFHHDKRPFYALEDLWSDAPRVGWATGDPHPRPPNPARRQG